jgi:DNA-binding response OmpR family regulator
MDTNWKHGIAPGLVPTRPSAAASWLARPFEMGGQPIPRPERVVCGPIAVDRAQRRAAIASTDLRLTERECALLLCLADRANRVVRRSDVLAEVWGLPDDDSNLVAVYIRRLRQKLGKHADMIVTVRSIGYRLRLPLEAATETDVRSVAS